MVSPFGMDRQEILLRQEDWNNLLQALMPLSWFSCCPCNPSQHFGVLVLRQPELPGSSPEPYWEVPLAQTGPSGAHLSHHQGEQPRLTQFSAWDLHILLRKGQLELWEEQGPFPSCSPSVATLQTQVEKRSVLCSSASDYVFSKASHAVCQPLQRPGEQHSEKPWAVPPMRRTGVEKRWKPGRISSPVGVGG